MNLTCFTSADPAAATVSMVYDRTVDNGHFWAREDPVTPLPPCPGSSASQCSVCLDQLDQLDQLVTVVCRNLTTGVKFFMEGPGGSISFNETGEKLQTWCCCSAGCSFLHLDFMLPGSDGLQGQEAAADLTVIRSLFSLSSASLTDHSFRSIKASSACRHLSHPLSPLHPQHQHHHQDPRQQDVQRFSQMLFEEEPGGERGEWSV